MTKTVGEYLLGAGALTHLERVLAGRADQRQDRVVYLIDHFFADPGRQLPLPVKAADTVLYVDTTDEPTTGGIDALVASVRHGAPVKAVVGIGGGSTLDTAKAVSNLLTNAGAAADYQGWDLVGSPGVFKVGVPTLSGTGAEASRTCVMMNHEKKLKLGMNSDHTVFDRLVLDPGLTASVPPDQYFFTGMDTYIHCVESLGGRYRHAFADACSEQALRLCRQVFLGANMRSTENREKLMIASFFGGSAIGNSYVGVVHPFSAGLSMVLHTHHCVANCIVMTVMDEFYQRETDEFRRMVDANGIRIPRGVCESLSDEQYRALYDATMVHVKPLANALGDQFRDILSPDRVLATFRRM
ncbi:MAG: iron-containing alcohol dehydrogenase [Actinobacteria bacterium]|nr:MAG: iron-containing alcohol dehydrogenase [Actinomycetota bacterium]